MSGLDEVFTKSNLNESKKKAKMIFGKLLINLRKNNRIKLYSLLESVVDTDINNNVIILTFSDRSSYDMIKNNTDMAILKDIISSLEEGLDIDIACNAKEEFDLYKFEMFLKDEFGKILTIKKD